MLHTSRDMAHAEGACSNTWAWFSSHLITVFDTPSSNPRLSRPEAGLLKSENLTLISGVCNPKLAKALFPIRAYGHFQFANRQSPSSLTKRDSPNLPRISLHGNRSSSPSSSSSQSRNPMHIESTSLAQSP